MTWAVRQHEAARPACAMWTHRGSLRVRRAPISLGASHRGACDASSRKTGSWRWSRARAAAAAGHTECCTASAAPGTPRRSSSGEDVGQIPQPRTAGSSPLLSSPRRCAPLQYNWGLQMRIKPPADMLRYVRHRTADRERLGVDSPPHYWYHYCGLQCMTQQRRKFYLFISRTGPGRESADSPEHRSDVLQSLQPRKAVGTVMTSHDKMSVELWYKHIFQSYTFNKYIIVIMAMVTQNAFLICSIHPMFCCRDLLSL